MRGPTDAEVMREQARIQTRLQLAFPGATVSVIGIADRQNHVSGWVIRVERGGVAVERAMRPDTPVEKAIKAFEAGFAEETAGGEA